MIVREREGKPQTWGEYLQKAYLIKCCYPNYTGNPKTQQIENKHRDQNCPKDLNIHLTRDTGDTEAHVAKLMSTTETCTQMSVVLHAQVRKPGINQDAFIGDG